MRGERLQGRLHAVFGGAQIGAVGQYGDGHVQIHAFDTRQAVGGGIGGDGFVWFQIQQVAQGLDLRLAAVFQRNQAVLRGKQRLARLRRLAGIGAAEAEFCVGNAGDFLILPDGFFGQRHGFVEVGDVEISVGHIVHQREPRVGHILLRGLIFPHLRVGGGTEFAPQIQLVAQTELAAVGAAAIAGFEVFRGGGVERAAEFGH